jgi:hypothetical protein
MFTIVVASLFLVVIVASLIAPLAMQAKDHLDKATPKCEAYAACVSPLQVVSDSLNVGCRTEGCFFLTIQRS